MSLFSSKAKSELERLIEENEELRNKIHSYAQKHNNFTELEEKIKLTAAESDRLNEKISQSSNRIVEIENEIEYKAQRSTELEKIIENKSHRIIELDKKIAEIDEVNDLYNKLNEKYGYLETSFQELQSKNLALEDVIKNLHEKEDTLRASTALAVSNLDDMRVKIHQVEEQYKETAARLKEEESQKSNQVKLLDEKISLSEEIKSNLETSIAALVGQLLEKEKMFTEFIDKRDSLSEELRLRQKEFDEHDYKFNYQRDLIAKFEEEVKQLNEKTTNLYGEIRKYEVVKIELQDEILSLRNEEERFTESLTLKHETIEELEKKKREIEESRLSIENNFSQVLQKFTEEISIQKLLINSLRQDVLDKEKELDSKEKLLLEKTTQVAEYSGLTRVMQKERAATEQMMQNLKEEFNELKEEYSELREKTNAQNSLTLQLKSENEILEMKKSSLELELSQIIASASTTYNNLDENKKIIAGDISISRKELDDLQKQIYELKSELRNLKLETANVATQKEDYSSKVSELIALEKNLKNKISEYQKKIEENG